ncbi:MAG: PHP domain-containing protein [Candidatus Altiarchaeota archaeon]
MLYELHTHTTYSDGLATPEELVVYAKAIGLSGIAVTDHDIIDGSLKALEYASHRLTVIPGVEVSSDEGHILALYVTKLIPRDLPAAETIELIHSQGGLAVAAHPYDRRRGGVGDLILKLKFDAVEAVNGHTFSNTRDPVAVCLESGISVVGGSDAHTLREVGSVAVEFEGDFRTALTSGKLNVKSAHKAKLLFNHGLGILKRKLR